MVTTDAHVTLVVSIVTYHSDMAQLTEALDSIKRQYETAYIIIVDNGSSSQYRETLQQHAPDDLIFAPRNGGYGYGHNLALLAAPPSDYFLILNPDVVLHNDAIEHLIAHHYHHPHAGLVVPKVFYPDGSLQALNKRRPNVLDLAIRLLLPERLTNIHWVQERLRHYMMLDVGYDNNTQLEFASGCCMMFRRNILMRLGGFDEGFFLYFEDADITRRCNELAQSWYCADAHITHHWQRASRKSLAMMWVMIQSAARYFAKWGWKWW